MKYKITYGIWAVLFALCAGLGFLPEDMARGLLTAISVSFFVPGALILFWGWRDGAVHHIKVVRNLAAWSLVLTMVLLAANLMSAMASRLVGDVLYIMLVIMSAPMVCSRIYALSLFLWACLLMTGLYLGKSKVN